MPYETLTFDVADRIATITVNRPDKLNALNDRVIAELGDAIDEARANATSAAIILTGAGRAFVAGADISELEQHGAIAAKALAQARAASLPPLRDVAQADDRRGERLRARRRLRARDGVSHSHRVGQRRSSASPK